MKLLFVTILLLMNNLMFGQNNSDSLIISNRVKVVRVLNAYNDLVSNTEYDSIGRLIYRFNYDSIGFKPLKSTLTKIYDINGNNIISVLTHSNFNKPTIWRYQYDNNGNRIATIDEFGNYVFRYFYNKNGFKIKELAYNAQNEIRRKSTFEVLENGNKVVERTGNNSVYSRINTKTLDDNGNIIKSESLDGIKINSLINNYYKNDKLIKTTYSGGYGKYYYYNKKSQLIKIISFKNEESKEVLNGYEEFIYNDLGLIIRYIEKKVSADNLKSIYHYEYDFYK